MSAEVSELSKHYHEAHRDEDGKLTRLCNRCGEDLLHESHIRSASPEPEMEGKK